MNEDYKIRMAQEYHELKEKYNRLHKILIQHEAGTLKFALNCPVRILEDQAYYMGNYLKILEIRAEIENVNLEI